MTLRETLWHWDDAPETITCETPDDAAYDAIDTFFPMEPTDLVTVYEFRRIKMPDEKKIVRRIEEILLDEFDEAFGNPEEPTDIPTSVANAIETLARTIKNDWPVWAMEPTGVSITKAVADWEDDQ